MPKRGQLTLAEFEPVLLKHERAYGNEPNIDLFEVVVAADISDATLFDAVRHFQVADRLMQFISMRMTRTLDIADVMEAESDDDIKKLLRRHGVEPDAKLFDDDAQGISVQ